MTKEQSENLKQGQRVFANGYEGYFVRHYYDGIIEIRLPGGMAAMGYDEVEIISKDAE